MGGKKGKGKKKGKKKKAGRAGGLSEKQRDRLGEEKFAFPKERKEPLSKASHVRSAISRFHQVKDVSDKERDRAWKRIAAAAKKYQIKVSASGWRGLGRGGKPGRKQKQKPKK